MIPAIHVNAKEGDYAAMICNGWKCIETRNSRTLDRFIGHRVGIIRTGCGPAVLVGFVYVTGCIIYQTAEAFKADADRHVIPSGSVYDFRPGHVKYGYTLYSPVMLQRPIILGRTGYTGNRVFRLIDVKED